jgi:hypothetical protein
LQPKKGFDLAVERKEQNRMEKIPIACFYVLFIAYCFKNILNMLNNNDKRRSVGVSVAAKAPLHKS